MNEAVALRKRVAELELTVAALEARVAMLEARPYVAPWLNPQPPGPVIVPPFVPPPLYIGDPPPDVQWPGDDPNAPPITCGDPTHPRRP